MTKEEIELINNGTAQTPFRVLLVTDEADALFLRRQCRDIEHIEADKDLHFFIERLKLTMEQENGIGIAAPQVGLGRNLFLFTRLDRPEYPVQVAINPRIVAHSDETMDFEGDGCLSIPDFNGTSLRYRWVDVEYTDQDGSLHKERLHAGGRGDDYTGVIFQHEYDHLQGILFTDRLVPTPEEEEQQAFPANSILK
ncbi:MULTISPECIES: peptide deformylase [unclassified Dysgonomonas]|uniref:peptide deformylase n=1 Tax=unclassified Dysgonomonas TaxID=2630389 RepID=UPI0024766D1B|nr:MULTISPECIES: peptide deformylase [unclassified Dysgonomonas]